MKDIADVLTCTMCSSFKKIYCEKGIACARGLIFDIEVDQGMPYFNGMLYRALPFYKINALVEGGTHFKEMHNSFSRESFKVFEHVLTQGCEPRMSISKSVPHIHWLPVFLHLFNTVTYPVIPAFCHSCLHCLLMEPQAQSK